MTEIENAKYYELGPRTFWLLIFQRSIIALVLLLFAAMVIIAPAFTGLNSRIAPALNQVLNSVVVGAVLLAILAEIIGIIVTKLEYGVSRIMLDEASLRIVRGILNKDEVVLPYRRIQSVEIDQNILQRILGVGHMAISSTTDLDQPGAVKSEADDQVVPLMDYELARAVAGMLTSRAEVERTQIQRSNVNS